MAPPADKKKPAASATSAKTATKKDAKPPAAKAKKPSGPTAEKTPKPAAVKVEKPKPAPAAAAPPKPTPPVAKKLESKTPKAPAPKKQAPAAVKKTEKKTVKPTKQPLKGKSAVLNKKKKISTKFIIDCTLPAEDQLFNSTDFEKFLKEKIKIQGKTGALGSNILIERGDKTSKLIINANIPFSKRYLKYLTKKYLKKMMLRDTLRVISTARDTYELRYFQIGNDADDDDEDND